MANSLDRVAADAAHPRRGADAGGGPHRPPAPLPARLRRLQRRGAGERGAPVPGRAGGADRDVRGDRRRALLRPPRGAWRDRAGEGDAHRGRRATGLPAASSASRSSIAASLLVLYSCRSCSRGCSPAAIRPGFDGVFGDGGWWAVPLARGAAALVVAAGPAGAARRDPLGSSRDAVVPRLRTGARRAPRPRRLRSRRWRRWRVPRPAARRRSPSRP